MSMMGKMPFFLGLQISQSPRGIFINQSKYASEIVKKYGMLSSDSVDTPLVEKSKLDEDLQGKPVDTTLYCGMIGSLIYLKFSRPDLTYAVCLCGRYHDTRRSTSGSAQFLGDKLVENGIVELYFVRNEYQLTDIFTKPLPREGFNSLIEKLVNDRARAKAVKSIKIKEWKCTGKMFKNVRYKWVPIGRTFTIVGIKCPLTRFTSTKIVPPRKPVKSTVITNIKPSSASEWRPKETNHASSSSAPKIVEFRTANHLEPNNHMGSNVSISSCSSSVQCRDDWDKLFQPMFDEYFNPPTIVDSLVLVAAAPRSIDLVDSPVSTSTDQDDPSISAVDLTLFTQKAGNDLLLVHNGIVELYFVRTEYQLANIFTKPLPRARINFLIEKLGIKSMSPETLKCLAEETYE
nr:hypothetical protein [Tanacetum cinerariifolium]